MKQRSTILLDLSLNRIHGYRAMTTVVQALSVFGNSRDVAMRTANGRAPPRTTGQ